MISNVQIYEVNELGDSNRVVGSAVDDKGNCVGFSIPLFGRGRSSYSPDVPFKTKIEIEKRLADLLFEE